MNTQLAFAFGMLVVVSIAMVIGIIISLVKVYKSQQAIRDVFHALDELHKRIDETHRDLDTSDNEMRRMIDSRFDKFENRLKSVVFEVQPQPAN